MLGTQGEKQGKSNIILIHIKIGYKQLWGVMQFSSKEGKSPAVLYTFGVHQGGMHQLLFIGAAQEQGSCGKKLKPYNYERVFLSHIQRLSMHVYEHAGNSKLTPCVTPECFSFLFFFSYVGKC